jgi:transglutaminase-like putative cysteine protease
MQTGKTCTWDPTSAICLLLIVFFSSYALELTYWTYDLNRVTSMALLGLFSGFAIGCSSFSHRMAKVWMFLYGSAFFFLQFLIPLNNDPSWLIRLKHFGERIKFTLSQLSRNIPLEDGILFLTGAGILYLGISMALGYRLARSKKLWVPFVILCGFYFLTQFYLPDSQRNYFFIALYTILVIFFLGRQTYASHQSTWREGNIKADSAVSSYFSRSLLLITIILGLAAWGVPSILKLIGGQPTIEQRIGRQRNSESWDALRNFFFPLRQQTGFGEGYFPEILSLGVSRSLKDDEVFVADIDNAYEYSGRYYWQGRVYDSFENGTWKNKAVELTPARTFDFYGQPIPDIQTARFEIAYSYPREVVFTPQFVLGVDRESEVLFDSLIEGQNEVISIVDYSLVRTGDLVTLLGGFNSASLEALEMESGEYPEWIIEKYLQLPENFSPKIRELAGDLSGHLSTNIDKAMSIINYLRSSFRYKNSVSIPQGEDPMEWFLFSGREGYCNYYSTAAALLLRSAGIPARLVVGYAEGERINGTNDYLVRISDSHSWVEAYFKGIGWIILEPTPSQPSVSFAAGSRSTEEVSRLESFYLQPPESDAENLRKFSQLNEKFAQEIKPAEKSGGFPRIIIPGLILMAVLGMLSAAVAYASIFRQRSFSTPMVIEEVFKEKKNLPDWIKRWAFFERQPVLVKNFLRLRKLSKLVIKGDPVTLTPDELFQRLFEKINHSYPSLFSDACQKALYAPESSEELDMNLGEYKGIVKSIFRQWFHGLIQYLRFRLNIGRFENLSF